MPDSPYEAMPPGPAPWPQQGFPPARGPSRLPIFLALGVAVVALGLAIGAWFRPTTSTPAVPATPQYSEQEVADAKTAMCDAYDTVYKSLFAAGTKQNDEPTAAFVIAVNTRLAFHVSGEYLQDALNTHPATPATVALAAGELARSYRRLALAQVAESPQSERDAISVNIDSAEVSLRAECK